MVRFEVGEGMEKKQEDFAAEVAARWETNLSIARLIKSELNSVF